MRLNFLQKSQKTNIYGQTTLIKTVNIELFDEYQN